MAAVMRGLDSEAYDRQYDDQELVTRIGQYFRPHKRKVIIITATIFLMALASAALPLVITNGIDLMTGGKNQGLAPLLVTITFIIGVGTWVLNWIRRQLTTEVIADTILTMRRDAFAAAARQDLSFYDEYSSGR
ncbi:MAG: hypothetical protein KC443_13240, partial [Anaerolineales bacterium]|nr:hypothetical protein [Anaerolineales bacterium]